MAAAEADRRPEPEALLAVAGSAGRGRLKIFLGAAPGVGKTWQMLAAARLLHEQGTDVVVGVVETHGRAATGEQIGDLPLLPRRAVSYRGRLLEEFALDTALDRHPTLLLLDELAHTNAPGLRHAKRWQDVAVLLDAGIDVWTTLNVQHLESLNDLVARISGVRVTETLPDTVLGLASEIELVDLPPVELRARLEQGRIYRPDIARRALEGFFRPGNLAALRELALRRVAQHVDRDITTYMRAQAIAGPWPAAERVMAVVEAGPAAEQVVRHAAHLAEALHAPFIAFHAETEATGQAVQPALDLAIQLGGTVETSTTAPAFTALLDAAARLNVAHIVVTRRSQHRLRFGLAGTLARRARAYAIHIPADPALQARAPARRGPTRRPEVLPYAFSLAAVALATLLGILFRDILPREAMGFVLIAIVVASASLYGRVAGISIALVSFVTWNFFFLPPVFTLSVADPRDVIGLASFLVVGVLTGSLAGRVRAEAEAARSRITALRRITLFGRALAQATDEAGLVALVEAEARGLADEARLVLVRGDELPTPSAFDNQAAAAARFAWRNQVTTGTGTMTLPSVPWRFMPVATEAGVLGILGIRPVTPMSEPVVQALGALADQAAMAIERQRLAQRAAESKAQDAVQRLRTALLSSLSHDLRTPLTAIRGAAETLSTAGDTLPETTRHDLLAAIEQDVGRMTRMLANITGMARIETGEIVARRENVDLGATIERAVARVPEAIQTAVNVADGAGAAQADPALLEQVLVNLLENAMKYGPGGGTVSIRAWRTDHHVAIDVADEGVGISARDLPHVFDSFYRAERGDRVAPGTGLGLAIARAFIDAMGGTIRAESPRADLPVDGLPGTIMHIELPIA